MAIFEGVQQYRDAWEEVYQAYKAERNLPAKVLEVQYHDNIPAWLVDVQGIKGLIPSSETGLGKALIPQFVGTQIFVQVTQMKEGIDFIGCSRQKAVEFNKDKLNFQEGQLIPVMIRGYLGREGDQPARLVVDVGYGVLAEIPRQQAARRFAGSLREQWPLGLQTQAKVTAILDGMLILSIKEALSDPWLSADFSRGGFISGTVVRVSDKLLFIEPDSTPGILGITNRPLRGEVSRGSKVTCTVVTFKREEKKLRLRLKGW
jgi:ribosomal protein S1